MKKVILVVLVIGLLIAGYILYSTPKQTNLSDSQSPISKLDSNWDDRMQGKDWQLEGINIVDKKDKKILGQYQNGLITVVDTKKNLKFTFPGDLANLRISREIVDFISYNEAQISTYLAYPNSGWESPTISYNCSSRMFANNGSEPNNFYYCSTNSKDSLSQLMFTGVDGIGFGTGGGYNIAWKKVYAKNTSYGTIYMIAPLKLNDEDAIVSNEDFGDTASAEQKNTTAIASSKKQLDAMLARPENKSLIQELDKVFANLQVSK